MSGAMRQEMGKTEGKQEAEDNFKYSPRIPIGIVKRLPWTRPYILKREISPQDTVLDLGCGPQSQLRICSVAHSVGVEIFEPYLRAAESMGTHDEYLNADVTEVEFEPASFDVVLALDVLDNLDKKAAYDLVEKMKQWARKTVIITIPNGYISEGALDDNPHQIHHSGYVTEELREIGFRMYGMGLKLPHWLAKLHEGQGLIGFLINELATYPLSLFTWYYPRIAGELVGVYSKAE